ncbi:hypothetical protein C7S17_3852 [Burkholderia thailandensis]|nr:hypothetical protein [Burkholderia thailandensis]
MRSAVRRNASKGRGAFPSRAARRMRAFAARRRTRHAMRYRAVTTTRNAC